MKNQMLTVRDIQKNVGFRSLTQPTQIELLLNHQNIFL